MWAGTRWLCRVSGKGTERKSQGPHYVNTQKYVFSHLFKNSYKTYWLPCLAFAGSHTNRKQSQSLSLAYIHLMAFYFQSYPLCRHDAIPPVTQDLQCQPQHPSVCAWRKAGLLSPQDLHTCTLVCLELSFLSLILPFGGTGSHIHVSEQMSHASRT